MTGYANATMIVAATASVLTYMHLNFASASDMSELKEIVVAQNIQRMMWRFCDNPASDELKRRIEFDRAMFERSFGHKLDWACTVN